MAYSTAVQGLHRLHRQAAALEVELSHPDRVEAGWKIAFAEAAYGARRRREWSAQEMAAACGLPQQFIETVEESGIMPTFELLRLVGMVIGATACRIGIDACDPSIDFEFPT